MKTSRVVLQLPDDLIETISANSTERTKSIFVADCIRKAMRHEQDGDGVLERLVAAVEAATKAMERAQ